MAQTERLKNVAWIRFYAVEALHFSEMLVHAYFDINTSLGEGNTA